MKITEAYTVNPFEKKILFWLRLIAFLFWCFLLAYLFNNSGEDAGNGWLIVSIVIVILHFTVTALAKVYVNRKK